MISDCCESKIIYSDICSYCKEHCESIKEVIRWKNGKMKK